jgi:hypothetical protein
MTAVCFQGEKIMIRACCYITTMYLIKNIGPDSIIIHLRLLDEAVVEKERVRKQLLCSKGHEIMIYIYI